MLNVLEIDLGGVRLLRSRRANTPSLDVLLRQKKKNLLRCRLSSLWLIESLIKEILSDLLLRSAVQLPSRIERTEDTTMSMENGFSSKDFKGHLQISHSQKCQANFTAHDRSYQTVNHGSEAEKRLTTKPRRGFLEVYKKTVKKLWHFIRS